MEGTLSVKTFNLSRKACLGLLLAIFCLGAAWIVARLGMPTEEQRDNRRVLDSILTAITMKNSRWLEQGARRAQSRHDAGCLSDEQYEGIQKFVNKARAGDWSGAEKDAYEFRKRHPFVKEGH
jgi:hypothetical protein